MSFAIYFAFVNSILSNNEGYKYKKATKGDYDYDYDSDAETVVYDFEEDAKDKEQDKEQENEEVWEQDFDDVETIVYEFEEQEFEEDYFNLDEGKIFNCVEYEKYIKTKKEENIIDEILKELEYISEEDLKEIDEDYINEILKEIDGEKEETEETEEENEEEEEDEEIEEEEEEEEEDDGINIIIEECVWPRVKRAEDSLTNHEVNQRGYKIICNKDEMFKRMYKTKKCPKSNCKLYGCPFYHNSRDRRIGVCAFERGCINPKCTLMHI